MRLIFLRHAESEFNANPSSKTLDCPLTERGVAQAAVLSGHYSLALVSPLRRAQQTLKVSKITVDKVLSWEIVREQRTDPCDFLEGEDPSQLETDDQLMERADLFLQQVQQQFAKQHKEILIVSHCEFIHAVTAQSPHNACYATTDLHPSLESLTAGQQQTEAASSSNSAETSGKI